MTDFDREAATEFLTTAAPRPEHDTAADAEAWSPQRARLLGALIEKGLATPQNYPLSLNALTMACNQTTNRDPITDFTEAMVTSLLNEAKVDGLARFVHPRSGRGVTKYRHVVDEALHLDQGELALVGVLLLRGPQTVNELRTRTDRLASFADGDEVENTLRSLADRGPRPLVRMLEREVGAREPRWIQLLCPAQGEDRAGEPSSASPRRAVSAAASTADPGEVAGLRAELAQVRSELAELRSAFESFKAEFG